MQISNFLILFLLSFVCLLASPTNNNNNNNNNNNIWQQYFDSEEQLKYYHNPSTGETKWDLFDEPNAIITVVENEAVEEEQQQPEKEDLLNEEDEEEQSEEEEDEDQDYEEDENTPEDEQTIALALDRLDQLEQKINNAVKTNDQEELDRLNQEIEEFRKEHGNNKKLKSFINQQFLKEQKELQLLQQQDFQATELTKLSIEDQLAELTKNGDGITLERETVDNLMKNGGLLDPEKLAKLGLKVVERLDEVYVKKKGSKNRKKCGTKDLPCGRIQYAIDRAAQHARIYVKEGYYAGPGNVNLAIDGRNIALYSKPPTKATIDCRNESPLIDPERSNGNTGIHDFRISNCNLQEPGGKILDGDVGLATIKFPNIHRKHSGYADLSGGPGRNNYGRNPRFNSKKRKKPRILRNFRL